MREEATYNALFIVEDTEVNIVALMGNSPYNSGDPFIPNKNGIMNKKLRDFEPDGQLFPSLVRAYARHLSDPESMEQYFAN